MQLLFKPLSVTVQTALYVTVQTLQTPLYTGKEANTETRLTIQQKFLYDVHGFSYQFRYDVCKKQYDVLAHIILLLCAAHIYIQNLPVWSHLNYYGS